MQFQDLDRWIITRDGRSVRLIKGGDINNPKHIIAYIDDVPKVKVMNRLCEILDHRGELVRLSHKEENEEITYPDVWITGPFKATRYRNNTQSREWCDHLLKALGFN